MSIGSRIHGTMKSVKTSSSSSIFEKKLDALCDVTIVVEGRKLHFFKLFLRVASPVFDRMLTSDFSEKQSSEIRLPDKTLEEVDIFLQNVHPAYAWKPLDDDSLGVLLRLASEYQTEHIREKCAHYINQQFNSLGKMSDYEYSRNQDPPKKIIFYICLCEQYGLPEVRENLLQLAAKIPVKVLERG
ncbi:BTB and MATH domain-containing protein 38-like [Babylonia areolata]|uniref:BTB and MATH domain-containing protein 38-like n=1 Tax=Babylonia areolata TaxID=304850 RepID=UPI003FCFEBDC